MSQIKNICIGLLIPLISWHIFLGIRDSDGTMFEYRVRNAMRWLELNVPQYVKAV